MKGLVMLACLVPLALSAMPDPARSLEWAGLQAEKHLAAVPAAAKFEYTGIVVQRANGTYAWSAYPTTNSSVDSVRVHPKDMLLPGETLAGLYHNHPCMPQSHFNRLLSKPDVMLSYIWGVPMFMLDMCTGDVHVYDPLHDHVRDTGETVKVEDLDTCTPITMVLPRGRIVGNVGRSWPDNEAKILIVKLPCLSSPAIVLTLPP